MSRRAAILGLGGRGLSWARICRDAGWEVSVFDPAPDAEAPAGVYPAATISGAVARADWVFCCVPERLELIRMVLQRAQAEAPGAAVLAVASREHDAEVLQSCAIRPGHVVRVDDGGAGEIALDVTGQNAPETRLAAETAFAELAAIRSVQSPPPRDGYAAGAESA